MNLLCRNDGFVIGLRRGKARSFSGGRTGASLISTTKCREDSMRVSRLGIPLAFAIMLSAALPVKAEPVKIRVGWIVAPASMVPLLFLAPGAARHLGKSYTFEPLNFGSSTLQITAISQSEIDIAAFGYTSFPLAVQNGGLSDLRIIADEIVDGAPGYYATQYFVRKDSGIEKIADMKGKVIATNGLGSGVDIAMRSALSKQGLQATRDYTVIEAPFPAHKALLKEKKADLVVGVLPFSYDPELNEFAKPLFTTESGIGQIALSFWAARKGFIDKNRAALVDLLEDTGAALRWYYDPKNREQAVALTAGFLKRPPAAFDGWLFTKRDFYRDMNARPDLKVVQSSIDKVKELGFIKDTLEVGKFADLSLVDEAAKRKH
jgi:NitT/TauT family transport system substrate-binding protein